MPSGSDEADPFTFTVRLLVDVVKLATGGWFVGVGAVTVTDLVVVAVAPELSRTVSVTV